MSSRLVLSVLYDVSTTTKELYSFIECLFQSFVYFSVSYHFLLCWKISLYILGRSPLSDTLIVYLLCGLLFTLWYLLMNVSFNLIKLIYQNFQKPVF